VIDVASNPRSQADGSAPASQSPVLSAETHSGSVATSPTARDDLVSVCLH